MELDEGRDVGDRRDGMIEDGPTRLGRRLRLDLRAGERLD